MIPEKFEFVRDFSEGLAPALMNGSWGYIDGTGAFVIPPRFSSAESFSEGLALVTTVPSEKFWDKNTKFGYIDRSGAFVIPERYNWAQPFSEGLAAACEGPCRNADLPLAKIGYINRRGEYVIPPQFSSGNRFSEGLAAVSTDQTAKILDKRFGYIDRRGRFVIAPEFPGAVGRPFSNGLASTDRGYIDKSGSLVIPKSNSYYWGEDFADGLGLLKNEPVSRFVDAKGATVLNASCASSFSEGLAAVCNDNYEYGFIDKSGKFVIPPRWRRVGRFSEGRAPVCVGGCVD